VGSFVVRSRRKGKVGWIDRVESESELMDEESMLKETSRSVTRKRGMKS